MIDNFDRMSQMTYDQKREYEENAKMTKELTPFEALKNMCEFCHEQIQAQPSKGYLPHKMCPFRHISCDYCQEYDIIEQALKALEIIKELPNEDKQVLLNAIYTYTKSEEKYDLLKEVLL